MTDFRARCAELVAAIDSYPIRPKAHRDLCNQVRAELEAADEFAEQIAHAVREEVRRQKRPGGLLFP